MDDRKQSIINGLQAWIKQRPGLEYGNYGTLTSYCAEQRDITKDLQDARVLLRAVIWRDGITADDLLTAAKHAYSGRLSITETAPGRFVIDYCTGQYWPTEYRKAVCAVLASALWTYQRESMPKPAGTITRTRDGITTEHDSINGKTPGDWLRDHFKQEFGRSIANRWFN